MRITFTLPAHATVPVGGFKAVYEHANRLQARGHQVTVVHPMSCEPKVTVQERVAGALWQMRSRLLHRPLVKWFSVEPGVELLLTPDLQPRHIPECDILVAASWHAAERVAHDPRSGVRTAYLVMDYEHYMSSGSEVRERIGATYRLGMRNIVISPACGEMVRACGGVVHRYVPVGVELDLFHVDRPLDDEGREWVGFPVRHEAFKRTMDAVAALEIVRTQLGPSLKVWAFGGALSPELPEWVEYHARPTGEELRTLYNRTSIFVVPSLFEGWGLPGSEAMACGAALVSTDNGGVRAYARDGENALLSEPGVPERLAENVIRLLRCPEQRAQLARRGSRSIRHFTWEAAADAFESALL